MSRHKLTAKDRQKGAQKRRGIPPPPASDLEPGDFTTWCDVWGWAPWDCGRRVLPHEHD